MSAFSHLSPSVRHAIIGIGAIIAILVIWFLWIVLGPDSMSFTGGHRVALRMAAGFLHRLEDARGGPTHGNGIGMLGRQRLDVGQHLEARVELVRVDRVHRRRVRAFSCSA